MKLNEFMRLAIAQGVYKEMNIKAGREFDDIAYLFYEQDDLKFCDALILEIVRLCDETAG